MAKSWYYEKDGARQGPFSKKEIPDLINNNAILPDTVLCNEKGKCYAAIQTDFLACFPPQSLHQKPLPAVSNILVWILVAVPLISSLIMYAFYFSGRLPANSVFLFPLVAALVTGDNVMLEKAGYQPIKNTFLWLMFFYPGYLFNRAKRLAQKQIFFALSLVMMAVSVAGFFAWPTLENKDVEGVAVNITDQVLTLLYPGATLKCERATLEKRFPWAVFEVTVHLSDGRQMRLYLKQSWDKLSIDPARVSPEDWLLPKRI